MWGYLLRLFLNHTLQPGIEPNTLRKELYWDSMWLASRQLISPTRQLIIFVEMSRGEAAGGFQDFVPTRLWQGEVLSSITPIIICSHTLKQLDKCALAGREEGNNQETVWCDTCMCACVSDWEYKCTTVCVRVRVCVCVREWVRVLDYSSVCVRVHVWVGVSEWVWEKERKKEVGREGASQYTWYYLWCLY